VLQNIFRLNRESVAFRQRLEMLLDLLGAPGFEEDVERRVRAGAKGQGSSETERHTAGGGRQHRKLT